MDKILEKFAKNTGLSFKEEQTFVFPDGVLTIKKISGKLQYSYKLKNTHRVDGTLKGLLEGGTQL